MGVSIWEGGKAERFVSALEEIAEKSVQKVAVDAAIVDDTAGSGDTDKVWSADKTASLVLPVVTSSDNGKILQVVNGVWAVTSLPDASGVNF